VEPFRIEMPDADLRDLRERLKRARWPERETVDDRSQGVPLAYLRELSTTGEWDSGYWNEPERGGHLAAFEQPSLFVDEVRAFFRLVR